MMFSVIMVVCVCFDMLIFDLDLKSKVVNCYYNYVNVENYFGKEVFFIWKGVVSGLLLSSIYLEIF